LIDSEIAKILATFNLVATVITKKNLDKICLEHKEDIII